MTTTNTNTIITNIITQIQNLINLLPKNQENVVSGETKLNEHKK